MTQRPRPFTRLARTAAAAALACLSLLGAGAAQAANHALIMSIDYAGTNSALHSGAIAADSDTATRIALAMGVPAGNVVRVRNSELQSQGMVGALDSLKGRIAEGDKVFLYFSGHGTQYPNARAGNKCTEAMVTANLQPFPDEQLQQVLEQLADKASQVVMLNDSCFSGGQATKELSRSVGGQQPKFTQIGKAGSANDPDYVCNNPVNVKGALSRSLGVVGRNRSTKVLYIAASADNEVAWVEQDGSGSTATKTWGQCLLGRTGDTDGNGIVDGDELRACSQRAIADVPSRKKQTITVMGDGKLPLSFVSRTAGNAPMAPANMARALESLRASADPTILVGLAVKRTTLTIGKDLLDFSVTLDRPGYLTLLHVGTDGKAYVLFPNRLDKNNYVTAGVHQFPKPRWGIQAQGPAGTGYFMAYWSAGARDFSKELDIGDTFATGEPSTVTTEKLGVVALDGRFGASQVVAIREVP